MSGHGDGAIHPRDGPTPISWADVPTPASSLPVLEGEAWELDCRIVRTQPDLPVPLLAVQIPAPEPQFPHQESGLTPAGSVLPDLVQGVPRRFWLLISVLSLWASSLPGGA